MTCRATEDELPEVGDFYNGQGETIGTMNLGDGTRDIEDECE